jgi:hypothetical protein
MEQNDPKSNAGNAPNEERVLTALKDLCAASSRQAKPGIQVVSSLDHLEVTLRFDSNSPEAKGGLGQTIVLDRSTLRKMAGLIAACAC